MTPLLRSLSFRLALVYAGLFTASVLALGGLYYQVAIASPLDDVSDGLLQEAEVLAEIRRQQGPDALAAALERRASDESARTAYHALLAPNGRPVTANLPSWPATPGESWIRIEADVAREGDEDEHEALALDRRLRSGERLLLGRDIEDLDDLQEGLRDTAAWLLPALLLLSLGGGALMSRAIGRRIDAVSAAARKVMEGDLSERIPIRGSGDDFDRLNAALNAMLDRIEKSMDSVRRVSDSVAHELRTPIARLQTSLAELEKAPTTTGAAEAAAEAERLGTIVDAILRISRVEAARHSPALARIEIAPIAGDAAEFYLPEAEARHQRLSVDAAGALFVDGDRDLIFQAIANLLDNAIKFSPSGGEVALQVAAEGADVVISVQDEGPGMPSELIDRATERFFRAPGVEAGGLGLGLSLVAAVAAAHRSTLRFASNERGFLAEWRLRRAS